MFLRFGTKMGIPVFARWMEKEEEILFPMQFQPIKIKGKLGRRERKLKYASQTFICTAQFIRAFYVLLRV